LIDFGVIDKAEEYITKEGLKNSSAKIFPKGTLLMAMYGQGKTRGKIAILGKAATTNQACAAILLSNTISEEFAFQNLAGRYDEIRELSNAGSQENLSGGLIKQISFITPTLPEQTKIANFLTTIDERINQLTRKKELMTQYKQGVMQQIFSQQLRFKDDNGEDFEDWEEKNGNFLFAAISNKDHNSDLPILAITQEHGAIPRDLIDYRVSVSDKSVETYKVVEVGDFIISLRSFQGGIEYSNYKGICSPAYLILRSKTQLNSYFYKSYFKTPEYITKLNQHLEGIRDGKMVSYKQFSEILLPLPCLAEQTKIANFLTAIDEKIQHIAKQIEATKQYKQGLLQQMFV